VLISEN